LIAKPALSGGCGLRAVHSRVPQPLCAKLQMETHFFFDTGLLPLVGVPILYASPKRAEHVRFL
jgi:hypothetical protein